MALGLRLLYIGLLLGLLLYIAGLWLRGFDGQLLWGIDLLLLLLDNNWLFGVHNDGRLRNALQLLRGVDGQLLLDNIWLLLWWDDWLMLLTHVSLLRCNLQLLLLLRYNGYMLLGQDYLGQDGLLQHSLLLRLSLQLNWVVMRQSDYMLYLSCYNRRLRQGLYDLNLLWDIEQLLWLCWVCKLLLHSCLWR